MIAIALVLIGASVLAIVTGIRGTHGDVWGALAGTAGSVTAKRTAVETGPVLAPGRR